MLTLAIQAGGESRRMGTDKGLVPFLGKPLIQRVIKRLQPLANDLLVTSNQPKNYRFLNLPVYPDLVRGAGALGGLYTALYYARHPLVVVVACDMPFASRELLAFELDMLEREDWDVLLPTSPQGLEPLHAIYRRETCLPRIKSALDEGERRLISWFPQVKVKALSLEETSHFDSKGLVFMNVNSREDLVKAESLARMEG